MKKLAIVFFGVFALASTSAKAAVYDFVAAEAAIGEGGYADLGSVSMFSGLSITGTSGGSPGFAYLDGPSGSQQWPGGLGVCDDIGPSGAAGSDGDECFNAANDSVATDEGDILSIDISGTGVDQILGITFNPGGVHGPADASFLAMNVDYSLDGGSNWLTSTFGGLGGVLASLTGISTLDLRESANGGKEFYVATLTTVPVPAAFWLFGTALLGFISLSRRVKV